MALWFVPVIVPPPSDSDDDSQLRRRSLAAVVVGMVVTLALGVGLLVMRSGSTTFPVVGVLIGIVLLLVMGLMVMAAASQNASRTSKRKRGVDGLDMYSLIDRLVDDLDEDEMAYLQRRLAERDGKPEAALARDLDDLLSQRTGERDAGRR